MEPCTVAWIFLLHFDLLLFAIPMVTALPFAICLFVIYASLRPRPLHASAQQKNEEAPEKKRKEETKDIDKQKTTTVIA